MPAQQDGHTGVGQFAEELRSSSAATTAAFVFESIFFGIRAPFRVGGDYTIFIFTSGPPTAIFSRFFKNPTRFDKNFAAKRFSNVYNFSYSRDAGV